MGTWENYKTIEREEYIISFYVLYVENEPTDKYFMEVVRLDFDEHFETKVINKELADDLYEIFKNKHMHYYTIEEELYEDGLIAD